MSMHVWHMIQGSHLHPTYIKSSHKLIIIYNVLIIRFVEWNTLGTNDSYLISRVNAEVGYCETIGNIKIWCCVLLTLIVFVRTSFSIAVVGSSFVTTSSVPIVWVRISWSLVLSFIIMRWSMTTIVFLIISSAIIIIPTAAVFLSMIRLTTYHTFIDISIPLRVVFRHSSHWLNIHWCSCSDGIHEHVRLWVKLRKLLGVRSLEVKIGNLLERLLIHNRWWIISLWGCSISPF